MAAHKLITILIGVSFTRPWRFGSWLGVAEAEARGT